MPREISAISDPKCLVVCGETEGDFKQGPRLGCVLIKVSLVVGILVDSGDSRLWPKTPSSFLPGLSLSSLI